MLPVRCLVVLLATGLLAACAPLGPASVAVERPAYSVVLQQTGDAVLFGNLTRLRYADTTSFIDVTSIADEDLRSRTTFAFLAQVYAVQAAPPATAAPIFVLPSGH